MANVGSWIWEDGQDCKLPQDVATGFGVVMQDMDGAGYKPMMYCGKQLVNGENHMLICKQTLVTAEPIENLVILVLHHEIGAAPDEKWTILSIKDILD